MYYYYCKKCGRIINEIIKDERDEGCDCCGSVMSKIPDEYRDIFPMTKKDIEDLREKYVKTSPEFDQYLYDHREEILSNKNGERDRVIAMAKAATAKPKIECPYCHSDNTTKISAASKAGSVFLFGLFSQKVRHQWHCNECGSDF